MGITYLISIIVLLIAIILVKKTEKKINIVSFLSLSIVTLFCYNTFVCYILTFFKVSITLLTLTLINLIFIVILVVKILKDKKIQNYVLEKIDILYISLILVIVLVISYINFGFPFDIKYETGDPSVHYLTAVMFAESDALLAISEPDEVYGSFNVRKTVSYVNSGLLMKCFCPEFGPIECYNIFVIFGILTLFLTGMTFYASLINLAKNRTHRLWAFLISIICLTGYPLNSFLFGFEYLSMALLIICAIINLTYYHQKDILDNYFFVILMALLNFGLFSSYYMFVTFIYPALWIYFCIQNYCKTKKIFTKKLIVILVVTLLIPFILGYIYHLAPDIYSAFIRITTTKNEPVGTLNIVAPIENITTNIIQEKENIKNVFQYSSHILNEGLTNNGYIYINIYSNMLLLLPLPLYLFIKDFKNNKLKENNLIAMAVLFNIAFIGLLLIGNYFEEVSIYYLSKNYFSLWILLLYCNYKALILLSEKGNYFPKLYIIAYILMILIGILFPGARSGNTLAKKATDSTENVLAVTDIFEANALILINRPKVYNQEELSILMYARENLDYSKKIEVISDNIAWDYALLRYVNPEPAFKGIYTGEDYLISKLMIIEKKINKVDYMIYFKTSDFFQDLEIDIFENSEIIYENETGGILKYKN